MKKLTQKFKLGFSLLPIVTIFVLSSCNNIEAERLNENSSNMTATRVTTTGESMTSETSPVETLENIDSNDIISKDTSEQDIEMPAEDEPLTTISDITETIPEETNNPVHGSSGDVSDEPNSLMDSDIVSNITGYNKLHDNGILVTEINEHLYALMPCWGTYTLCSEYAENLNDYAVMLPNVNVYSMIIPTIVEFYLPQGNENFTGNQLNKINYITEALINVTNVDAYGALRRHTNEEIYARTDHHWLPLGAYYAVEKFAESAGVPFTPLSEYEKVTRSGYIGSMYNYTKDINLYNDPEDFTMYIPSDAGNTVYYDMNFKNGYESSLFLSTDASAYYCSFLGSDNLIAEITTTAETGRTLVIFKESFGNALVPFLTSSFDKIYVCDIRYFNLNAVNFCKEVGATDLLFAVCSFTAAGDNGKYIGYIK